ncbi:MAG: sugar ABC transporter permease [Clostridia bacterium]|nr:sugar ABC transporter permease [Clostridia bacterium]
MSVENTVTKKRKYKSFGDFVAKNRSQVPLTLMTLPAVILVIMFSYVPMFGIILAFKDFNVRDGIFGSPWSGLANFTYLFKSNDAFMMLRNTLGYNLLFLTLGTALNVTLAIAISLLRGKWGKKIYQTIYIMPHFLSMVIVSYLVLSLLNMEHGFMNNTVLPLLGLDPVNWYTAKGPWPFILPIVNFWKWTGYSSIMYIAAIAGIDSGLYEAAAIDGATLPKQIWHITLPSLRTLICIQIILNVGSILGGDFGLYYQVPMNSGAIKDVTTTIPVYVFKNLTSGSADTLGLASATSFLQSIVGCILVVSTNKIVDKISGGENSLF